MAKKPACATKKPKKAVAKEGGLKKAVAASVAKKDSSSPLKVKGSKPKRTAKSLPKSKVARTEARRVGRHFLRRGKAAYRK